MQETESEVNCGLYVWSEVCRCGTEDQYRAKVCKRKQKHLGYFSTVCSRCVRDDIPHAVANVGGNLVRTLAPEWGRGF